MHTTPCGQDRLWHDESKNILHRMRVLGPASQCKDLGMWSQASWQVSKDSNIQNAHPQERAMWMLCTRLTEHPHGCCLVGQPALDGEKGLGSPACLAASGSSTQIWVRSAPVHAHGKGENVGIHKLPEVDNSPKN
eukprot:1159962-Pelagomonas_calceolata.AAC.6